MRKFFELFVVRHDKVGTDADEAIPLPWIDFTALGFCGRHTNGSSAHLGNFFNFDISIAENKQFFARITSIVQHALDKECLRKAGEVVEAPYMRPPKY